MSALFLLALQAALPPVSGAPVPPELAVFDQVMLDYMSDNDIAGGVLGVMKDGCIVYLRGFGTMDVGGDGDPLPENTPMRIASIEKPITAAAIRMLVQDGDLHVGQWTGWDGETKEGIEDYAFDFGQPGGGILDFTQWGGQLGQPVPGSSLGIADIRVEHLLRHTAGLDISPDPQGQALCIAEAMNVANPPGRQKTVEYVISQDMVAEPGSAYEYSNFGYMVLGLVIEELTGSDYFDFVRSRVLTPSMWVPATELFLGRSFDADQDPREPEYESPGDWPSVFDPNNTCCNDPDHPNACDSSSSCYPAASCVPAPYGGWHQESLVGHGNAVASAAALLTLADTYWVNGYDIGLPYAKTKVKQFNGVLDGTNTALRQRPDDVHIVVLFNKRCLPPHVSDCFDNGGSGFPGCDNSCLEQAVCDLDPSCCDVEWTGACAATATLLCALGDPSVADCGQCDTGHPCHYAAEVAEVIDNLVEFGVVTDWPTDCVDGFWVDFTAATAGVGGYDAPFPGLDAALGATTAGSKLRLTGGGAAWTGVISELTLLEAPAGPVVLGAP